MKAIRKPGTGTMPALDTDEGTDFVGRPARWGMQQRDDYTTNRYHKPQDELDSKWDLSGAVEDLQLLFQVGYRVANDEKIPQWSPGNEFKARRDEMMKSR